MHVRKEHMAQVPLAKDDDMVKTFPPDRANQPFSMSILPWRSRRGGAVANAHRAKPPGECRRDRDRGRCTSAPAPSRRPR